MQILDCTLRDGGYYTNWDFAEELVEEYAKTMELLPIDYIEVGYRSIPLKGYFGKYFYCPINVLEKLKRLMPSKRLTIILNEKDIRPEHVEALLGPCKEYITLVRIAIDPQFFDRAIILAKAVKKLGFEVGFNVMYMSKWKENGSFLNQLEGLEDTIDFFYMVDSFGGVMPDDVREITRLVKSKTKIPIGFHGHNNLEMAFSNTLIALEEGCSIIDATITGMGRGAGNLKTELLLTYLERNTKVNGRFDKLSNVVGQFEELKEKFKWGTNLPYMFSGAHSLPQKQVMEWVGMNRYPLGSILNALNNQKESKKDNFQLPILEKGNKFKSAVVLGGGSTVTEHKEALQKFVESSKEICLIHAGVRHASTYLNVNCNQYYAMVGFESDKLLRQISDPSKIQTCVYQPYPRPMGTLIPDEIKNISQELDAISFTSEPTDSPMAIALQIAINLGVDTIYLSGFDGYIAEIDQTQYLLAQENQIIIDDLVKISDLTVFAVTPTKYKNIKLTSLYSLV